MIFFGNNFSWGQRLAEIKKENTKDIGKESDPRLSLSIASRSHRCNPPDNFRARNLSGSLLQGHMPRKLSGPASCLEFCCNTICQQVSWTRKLSGPASYLAGGYAWLHILCDRRIFKDIWMNLEKSLIEQMLNERLTVERWGRSSNNVWMKFERLEFRLHQYIYACIIKSSICNALHNVSPGLDGFHASGVNW